MNATELANQKLIHQKTPWTWSRVLRWLLGLELILLLALAQVMYAGYGLGVGNQSIQIPFLKHWVDPKLFAGDVMVKQTLADYPSFFFKMLAVVMSALGVFAKPGADGKIPFDPVVSGYFWLHVLTSALVLLAAYGLGRAIFRNRWSGIVLVLLMLAGHHRALAGDDLYSVGFTHTWAVFPLAIAAMMLLYKEWHLAAFALVGVIFNLHALTAGYLLAMFLVWAASEFRRPGWWWRCVLWVGVFAVLASPTVIEMLRHRQIFDANWIEKTRIRSADHSFPSSWWTDGASDIPRFLILLGLAAVSLSFAADRRNQKKSLMLAAGAGILFLIGTVFTELWPSPTVLRAQLFRASRLLMVLMLAHVAHGIVCAWRLSGVQRLWQRKAPPVSWQGSSPLPPLHSGEGLAPSSDVGLFGRVLEIGLATAAFVILAVPGLMPLAFWLLLAVATVALANARLSWGQAVVVGAALLVSLVATQAIQFHIPLLDGRQHASLLKVAAKAWHEAGWALPVALLVAGAVWFMIRLNVGPRVKLCALVMAHFGCVILARHTYVHGAYAGADKEDPWINAQLWAAKNTPVTAVFMTPPQKGGWRIFSNRSVVCEWRDGTQLYFSAGFAKDWWERLTQLRPVIYSGHRQLVGQTLEQMSDTQIVALANQFGATHVVLPCPPNGQQRTLNLKFDNGEWAVYEPRILSKEEAFFENEVLPNIDKHRKSDVRLELADASGAALSEGQFEVRQTGHAFGFGVSLPPFGALDDWSPEWTAPPVTPKQLDMVKGVFNYSMIPFSAKWNFIEPEEGRREYAELDKYVEWCTQNGLTMEFHYLGGFMPKWALAKYRSNPEEVKAAWLRYCMDTVDRYQDKIKYWQITNDARVIEFCPDVFQAIRAKYPHLKLGLSNCSAIWMQDYNPEGTVDITTTGYVRGLEEVRRMQSQGIKVDYYASHAHKPNGARADMIAVYQALDAISREGVKLHATEVTLDVGLPIINQKGETWDENKAADYFEKYYTLLFSHPAMEAINYWDLSHSVVRSGRAASAMGAAGTGKAGLLDPANDFAPRATYTRIREMITRRWSTREAGSLGADGSVSFRGFHGAYEVTVKTAAGKTLKGTFTVKPTEGTPAPIQLKLTEDGTVAAGK